MKTLNESQIFQIIDHLYAPQKQPAANKALINVFFNDVSMYKAEIGAGLPKNSLMKKVKRVRTQIEFIESLFS